MLVNFEKPFSGKVLYFFSISFLQALTRRISAEAGELDAVQDTDEVEVKECARGGYVIVFEGSFAGERGQVRVATE